MKGKTSFSELLPQEQWGGDTSTTVHHFLGVLASSTKKTDKFMVSPDMVGKFTENHVSVLMQRGVGKKWGIQDIEYADQGAELFDEQLQVIEAASLIVKTSNFTAKELSLLKEGQTIISDTDFSLLKKEDAVLLKNKKVNALAYNLITDREGKRVVDNMAQQILGDKARDIAFSEFLLPIIINLMFNRIRFAVQTNPAILQSIYCYGGILTNRELAETLQMKWQDILLLCWNWN